MKAVLLLQILQDEKGETIVMSKLPPTKVVEILIRVLEPTYNAAVVAVKAKSQIVKPGRGIINRIRSLHK